MAVNWSDLDEAYRLLIQAKSDGREAIMQRLSGMALAIDEATEEHVREVVTEGRWSWQRVGDALGVSRQAASKKWRNKVLG